MVLTQTQIIAVKGERAAGEQHQREGRQYLESQVEQRSMALDRCEPQIAAETIMHS